MMSSSMKQLTLWLCSSLSQGEGIQEIYKESTDRREAIISHCAV